LLHFSGSTGRPLPVDDHSTQYVPKENPTAMPKLIFPDYEAQNIPTVIGENDRWMLG
jgi:hypothetical protein